MRTLVFDTETTALLTNSLVPNSKNPYLMEFCGITIEDDGSKLEELDFLCKPPIKVPKEASDITHITDALLEDKKPFSEWADEVQELIARSELVVAHNLSFDMRILNIEFDRIGRKLYWPDNRVCTVEATEHFKGYRLNLNALHMLLFGENFSEAHRARNDVEALCRCWVKLLEMDEV